MSTANVTHSILELDLVEQWRLDTLERAGYDAESAAVLAASPEVDLIRVPSRDGRTIAEDDLIAAMTDEVALVLVPSVLYRSGQLLDIERLASAARERGIVAGFDCAHSAGAVPHRFDDWGVDFAFWCTYKYLNAGPGSVGALRGLDSLEGLTWVSLSWLQSSLQLGVQPSRSFEPLTICVCPPKSR